MSTYKEQESVTFEELYNDFRDDLSGLPGWSKIHDETEGPEDEDKMIVYSTPWKEDFGIEWNRFSRFTYEFSIGFWDDETETWESTEVGEGYANVRIGGPDSDAEIDETDQFEYWFYGDDDGFWSFWRRIEADGDDGAQWIGLAEIQTTWNTDNAENDLGQVVMEGWGTDSDVGEHGTLYTVWDSEDYCDAIPNGVRGTAGVNPDSAINNYIWRDNVIVSDNLEQPDTGERAELGTHDMWVYEISGTNTDSDDRIQDDNGEDVAVVLKYHGIEPAAFRIT